MRGVRESDGRLVRQRVGQKCRARRPPHSLFVGKESAAGMKYTMQEVPSNYSRKGKLSFLLAALAGLALAFAPCMEAASAQGTKESVWPTKEWQTSTPEQQGVDSTELARLGDFGTAHETGG